MSKIVGYVPHGINPNIFRPLMENEPIWKDYQQFKKQFEDTNEINFVVFWNNRNVRRKQPGDVILSFKNFCDKLKPTEAKKCILIMHTALQDENGTDLIAVKKAIAPDYKILFSDQRISETVLNFFYNLADVTLNIASNEGFGISAIESLMAGTPIINNVTGGLQDHLRFEDENGNWINFDSEFQSNHIKKYTKHGIWCTPVYPSNRSLQGSIPTPYIFDDRCDYRDVGNALYEWYLLDRDERKRRGLEGRKWAMSKESGMSSDEMCRRMKICIDKCLETFVPVKKFQLIKVVNEPKILDKSLSIG